MAKAVTRSPVSKGGIASSNPNHEMFAIIDNLKNELMYELYESSKMKVVKNEVRDDLLVWMDEDNDPYAGGKEFDLDNLPGTENWRLNDIETSKKVVEEEKVSPVRSANKKMNSMDKLTAKLK